MKQLLFIFALLFSFLPCFGQNQEMDTVFIKSTISDGEYSYDTLYFQRGISRPPVLVGTMVLTDSQKNFGLQNDGLDLMEISVLESCKNGISPDQYQNYPQFQNVVRDSTTLTVDVSIVTNCCYDFLGEAEVQGDTLNLLYTGYGMYCSCSCCFTLRYIFNTELENYSTILKHVMINGKEQAVAIIPEQK